jgi:hypothetical protein
MMRPDQERAFKSYGLLMAKIGGLEQFMRIALGEHLTKRTAKSGSYDRAALEREAAKIMKKDFGQLLHQVYTKFKFHTDVLQVLKEAKDFRDHLAHDFWVCHLGNLRSERGTEIITEHCELLGRQFDKVSDLVIAVTGLDAAQYVNFVAERAGNDENLKGWEERLEAAREAEAVAAEIVRKALRAE